MKKLLAIWGMALGALLSAAPASAVVTATFSPASSHINVGDSVVVDFTISGLGDEILSGFDFNFLYNPSVLNWQLITYYGGNLGNTLGLANNGLPQGNLGLIDVSLDDDATLAASQANTFLLFSFTLQGMADGATTFTLGSDLDFERNFVGLDFASLGVDVGSACISVGTGTCDGTPVPEPGTLALLGLGILGLGMSRRRHVA